MGEWIGSLVDGMTLELVETVRRVINVQGFIIVCAPERLPIGFTMAGLSDLTGKDKLHHPFTIVRECKYEEWVKQNREVVGSTNPTFKPTGWDYFYEVRTD